MKSIERYMGLMEIDTEEKWCRGLFDIAREAGFDRTLLAIVPKPGMRLEQAFLRSNYSPAWRAKYDSEKLAYVDPTVEHCQARTTSLAWSPEIFRSRQQKRMYEEASAHGLRSGITLPIHGPNGELGMLCLVNDAPPDEKLTAHLASILPQLSLLRDIVFESAARFVTPPPAPSSVPALTPRERECLCWTAEGKSTWEIAKILDCSEAVVNFHIANLRQKFDVGTRREVVVKAIRLGVISLS